MEIATLEGGTLLFLNPHWVRLGPPVLANSSDLPRHFHAKGPAGDLKSVLINLFCDVEARDGCPYGSKLIAKVGIDFLKPAR